MIFIDLLHVIVMPWALARCREEPRSESDQRSGTKVSD